MKRSTFLLALFALSAECGPNIMEMRMASAPPRPDNCELQFLQLTVNDLSPMGGTYEQLGSVVLYESGVQDPFQEKYKAIVRPRACAMGGEGVTLLMQATTAAMGQSGSSVNYAVVRKRPAPDAAPPPPSKF